MLAKKAIGHEKKTITRDKEAKIGAIIDATKRLIEVTGYEKVTIRDISEAAGVSIGLIYKYFPGGKFDIIIKGLGAQNLGVLLAPPQPETIDYEDFPGYMRAIIRKYRQILKENGPLVRALIAASLSGGDILEGAQNIDVRDFVAVSEFFGRFKGVDIGGKDPAVLLLKWGATIKGILIFDLIYPLPLMDDEAYTELLVDLSLRIWDYQAF